MWVHFAGTQNCKKRREIHLHRGSIQPTSCKTGVNCDYPPVTLQTIYNRLLSQGQPLPTRGPASNLKWVGKRTARPPSDNISSVSLQSIIGTEAWKSASEAPTEASRSVCCTVGLYWHSTSGFFWGQEYDEAVPSAPWTCVWNASVNLLMLCRRSYSTQKANSWTCPRPSQVCYFLYLLHWKTLQAREQCRNFKSGHHELQTFYKKNYFISLSVKQRKLTERDSLICAPWCFYGKCGEVFIFSLTKQTMSGDTLLGLTSLTNRNCKQVHKRSC